MSSPLNSLYRDLASVFNTSKSIDDAARSALLSASESSVLTEKSAQIIGGDPLPQAIQDVMAEKTAHPICQQITKIPFTWLPPHTSDDPLYIAHSLNKVHVELIGPDGIMPSDTVRIGLYGILPETEYGIRSHIAEETFKMLAGECYWRRGEVPYTLHKAGEESYHPSMMPHATKTTDKAFMSIYVWSGDVSFDSYNYEGIK